MIQRRIFFFLLILQELLLSFTKATVI